MLVPATRASLRGALGNKARPANVERPMKTSKLVIAGGLLAAMLLPASAHAAYTAQVDAGVLKVTGDGASDKLRLDAGRARDAAARRRRRRHHRLQLRQVHVHRAGGHRGRRQRRGQPRPGRGQRQDRQRRWRRRRRHRCWAAPDRRPCSGAAATTPSTATSAPTWRCSAPATTASPGTRVMAPTPSKARAAPTRWTSTVPTSASSSTLSANGNRVRFTRNVASITMDLDDVEALNLLRQGRRRHGHRQRPHRHRPQDRQLRPG